MSELKDFYVEKIGHNSDLIENSSWYLSELALRGATEIDNHFLSKSHDFSHVQELAEILGKYQLKDTDTAITEPCFPYLPLWRSFRKGSGKNIRYYSELALEMKLFGYELKDVPANSTEDLKKLRFLLCDLSKEFSNESFKYEHIFRLVA